MALKLKGEASFSLDGKELAIVINIAVMMAAEQETGVNLLGAHGGLENMRLTASLLRHALVAGGGKEVSLPEAAEMLMTGVGVHAAVITAFEGFLPKPETEGGENPPKAATGGTGTTS